MALSALTVWVEVDCDPVALWFMRQADDRGYVLEYQEPNPVRCWFFVTGALDMGDNDGL